MAARTRHPCGCPSRERAAPPLRSSLIDKSFDPVHLLHEFLPLLFLVGHILLDACKPPLYVHGKSDDGEQERSELHPITNQHGVYLPVAGAPALIFSHVRAPVYPNMQKPKSSKSSLGNGIGAP